MQVALWPKALQAHLAIFPGPENACPFGLRPGFAVWFGGSPGFDSGGHHKMLVAGILAIARALHGILTPFTLSESNIW